MLTQIPKNAARLLKAVNRALSDSEPSMDIDELKKEVELAKRKNAREAVFQPEFREDLKHWVKTDRKIEL